MAEAVDAGVGGVAPQPQTSLGEAIAFITSFNQSVDTFNQIAGMVILNAIANGEQQATIEQLRGAIEKLNVRLTAQEGNLALYRPLATGNPPPINPNGGPS